MSLSLPNHEPRCAGRDHFSKKVCAEKFICKRYAVHQHEKANPDGYVRLVWVAVAPDRKTGLCEYRMALQPERPVVTRRTVSAEELAY